MAVDETLETGPADVETPTDATTDAPAGAASETEPAEAAPEAEELSVEQLIAEYTEATKPAEVDPEAPPATQAAPEPSVDELLGEHRLAQELEHLKAQKEQQERAYADHEDLLYVWESAIERTADLAVTEDYIRRFLLSEYYSDPALRAAWDNRLTSQDALELCNRQIDQAINRLRESAQGQLDPEATADAAAVAHAVRGASATAPAERPPDYSSMSNEEFRKAQLKHGYSTI